MDTKTFLDNFGHIADAPNGVKKLRNLIQQLAIKGRLVDQDSEEKPATDLLEKILTQKKELTAQGKLKTTKVLPAIDEGEISFTIPGTWSWARFGDITINRDGERIPVSKEERQHRAGQYDYYGASGIIDKIDGYLFDKPLLLIGEDGANLLARSTPIAFIATGKYWVNNHAHVLDGISLEFLRYIELYINATDLESYVTGTAQPKMNQAKMNSIVVAVPPEEEQKRIVAKVDQLMALCDQLETQQKQKSQTRVALNNAALDKLLTAQNPDEFNHHWQRIANNLHHLYDNLETLARLRAAIVQMGVDGKLVDHEDNKNSTADLLAQIYADKFEKYRGNELKAKIREVSEGDQYFSAPRNWEWVHLGDVVDMRLGKMLDKSKNKGEPKPYLRNTNVQWQRFDLSDIKTMKFEESELEEFTVRCGDLLLCEGGEPGRCAIWKEESIEIYFQKALHRLRPFGNIDSQFLLYRILSDTTSGFLPTFYTGATIKHLTGKALVSYYLPLPPVEEQKRIVAKVDQLMTLCDQLETKLKQTQTTSEKLVEATVKSLVAA